MKTPSPSMAGSQAPRTMVIERTYAAPLADLWALWTTKEGFESWWGPQGFRAEVHLLEARLGGTLRYDMVADTPEMIAAMKQMGQPASHGVSTSFSEFQPQTRLALKNLIDFLPGVTPYANTIGVDFIPEGDHVRMVCTLEAMHDEHWTNMQVEGFTSQIGKLDQRYGWKG